MNTAPKTGLAAKVRAAAQELKTFNLQELRASVETRTYAERKRVRDVLRDLVAAGEVRRIAEGRYLYTPPVRRTFQDIIWHLARSHRRFNTDTIERLSGAARDTVTEYLRCLRDAGCLRLVNCEWHLIHDPGPATPVNWTKCRRLRALRARQREICK
ncbi:MAG: hypothetical protein AB1641_09795 [Thermodesulfobacteriota bacterium]